MNTPNDGGPAFPRDHRHDGHNGMTLRDWFAGQIVAGMWACSEITGTSQELAKTAYENADAMLEARKGGAARAPRNLPRWLTR